MSVSVLAECNFDGVLLERLLKEEQQSFGLEIRVVQGLTSGFSYARTMLGVKRTPVAVVFDADSPDPESASEKMRRAEEVLGDAAGSTPYRVIVAVPELEILFFRRLDLLSRVFGDKADAHVLELAQLSPRRAIERLAAGEPFNIARFRILREMNDEDIKALRETDLIQELLNFIKLAVAYLNPSAVTRV